MPYTQTTLSTANIHLDYNTDFGFQLIEEREEEDKRFKNDYTWLYLEAYWAAEGNLATKMRIDLHNEEVSKVAADLRKMAAFFNDTADRLAAHNKE